MIPPELSQSGKPIRLAPPSDEPHIGKNAPPVQDIVAGKHTGEKRKKKSSDPMAKKSADAAEPLYKKIKVTTRRPKIKQTKADAIVMTPSDQGLSTSAPSAQPLASQGITNFHSLLIIHQHILIAFDRIQLRRPMLDKVRNILHRLAPINIPIIRFRYIQTLHFVTRSISNSNTTYLYTGYCCLLSTSHS